jgi:ankyrin repeat protein
LEQYRRQAKELLRDVLAQDAAAVSQMKSLYPAALDRGRIHLAEAQHAIARREGFSSWSRLKAAVVAAEKDAFFIEVRRGDTEAVSRRLRRLPELIDAVSADGESVLHVAAGEGHTGLAELLVQYGADPRKRFAHSAHTPLSWAITVGSFDFAREMVRLGDEPDLFCAAGLGDVARVRAFWPEGQLIERPSYAGSSRFTIEGARLPRPPESAAEQVSDALYIAARHGRLEVAEWLLAHGADPNFRGYIGGTPMHWAEFSGNLRLAQIVRDAGGLDDIEDFEFRARPRAFGILVAAAWGMTARLGRLLDLHPEDVDIMGAWGTPLNEAARSGQLEATRLLLERGADRARTNHRGETPFEVAHYRRHREVAALLAAE